MIGRRARFTVTLSLLLAGSVCGEAGAETPLDEAYLRQRGIAVEPTAVMALLNRQTAPAVMPANLDDLIQQLGHTNFEKRDRAGRAIVAVGAPALSRLRQVSATDLEISRRASLCLDAIESRHDPTMAYYAVRYLTRTHPRGTAEVLFRYLPLADADTVTEIWFGIEKVALAGSGVDPVFRAALTDEEPRCRALAAYVLGRYGTDADRAQVCARCDDKEPEVRLRAAQGLLAGCDRRAVPALLALLNDSTLEIALQAEEMLHYLAGDQAPAAIVTTGTKGTRVACQAAWRKWWSDAADRLDWEQIGRRPARPGLMLVCSQERAWLCGCDGKSRWQLPDSANLSDCWPLPGLRFLAFRRQEARVYECGVDGKAVWSWADQNLDPVGCQPLPNGNRLVFGQDSFAELGPDGKPLSQKSYSDDVTVAGAVRLRNGTMVARLLGGDWGMVEMDENGQFHYGWTVAGDENGAQNFAVTVSADGTCYVREGGPHVASMDCKGNIRWRHPLPGAADLTVLPRGGLLVADNELPRLCELDSEGHVVWEACVDRVFEDGSAKNGIVTGGMVMKVHDAFPLLRVGFDRSHAQAGDLNSVANRIRNLSDKDPAIRRAAINILAAYGPAAEAAVPALVTALADSNSAVGTSAANALVAVGPAAVPEALEATHSASAATRSAAWSVLQQLGPQAQAATPDLIARMKNLQLPQEERSHAADVIGAIGPAAHDALPALCAVLEGTDDQVRYHAAIAVARVGTANEATPRLLAVLSDTKYPQGRLGATRALAQVGPGATGALPKLVQQLCDRKESLDLRSASAAALGSLTADGKPAVVSLASVLRDTQEPDLLRVAAAQGLAQLGRITTAAAPVYREILCDPATTDCLANATLQALGALGPDAHAVLLRVLVEGPVLARRFAARQLRSAGNAAATLPVLQSVVESEQDQQVRRGVEQTMRSLQMNLKRNRGQ